MQQYRLKSAYLEHGWTQDAVVAICADGFIDSIDPTPTGAAAGDAEYIDGIVIPGMPNAHSHAFQRAMAGDAEYRLSTRDSFWNWRQTMYALANRLEADELRSIATQLFVEMLKAGYTSVAEFHYLHRQRDGAAYHGENALWNAVSDAADIAGIGLTLLPTLYQTSDFGGKTLKAEQARFFLATDAFLEAVESRVRREQRGSGLSSAGVRGAGRLSRGLHRCGAAFHSLRAVPMANVQQAAAALRALDATMPLHIHIAEQLLEVEACQSETGFRPIELLLNSGLLDEHWCLVHATHATPAEIKGIAASQAAVCVSITTEANLGDGCFDSTRFLRQHGRLCIGSDSQASVSPSEELRWLEYQARLRKQQRAVLATPQERHVGTALWRDAALHGAQALGQPVGALAVGRRADWLVLDAAHPSMAGAELSGSIDRLLFAGGERAIRDVMVAGQWRIKDGRHSADDMLQGEFAALRQRLRLRDS